MKHLLRILILAAALLLCACEDGFWLNRAKTPVSDILLDKGSVALIKGDQITLSPTIIPASASNKTIIWSSSDEDVASVYDGTVTAISNGEAIITATTQDGNKTASCLICVGSGIAISTCTPELTSFSLKMKADMSVTLKYHTISYGFLFGESEESLTNKIIASDFDGQRFSISMSSIADATFCCKAFVNIDGTEYFGKEQLVTIPETTFTFKFTITKAEITEDSHKWNKGDNIYLSDGTISKTLTVPASDDGKSECSFPVRAIFSHTSLFCLHNKNINTSSGVSATIKNEQSDISESHIVYGIPTSEAGSEIETKFHTAVLSFVLENTSGFTSIILKGNGREQLAGEYAVSRKGITSIAESTSITRTINGDGEYNFVVNPTTLTSGFTIALLKGSGKTYTKKTSSSLTITGGIIYKFPAVDCSKLTEEIKADYGWFELPAQFDEDHNGIDDFNPDLYYSHTFRADAKKIRNFSSGYSKSKLHPVWVAAPMHKCYKGSSGRSNAYGNDPNIGCSQSPKFSGYTRGHMVSSSDRTVSTSTNRQVFYYSNIGAQLSDGFNTGGGAWNNCDDYFVAPQFCDDTLYSVIGCIFEEFTDRYGKTVKEKTASNTAGGTAQIPTAWFNALMRTKSGKSGKSLDKCSSSEIKCVAVILGHYSNAKHKVTKDDLYSIEDLEKLTGMTFFVNVPNAPKSSFSASDWGL